MYHSMPIHLWHVRWKRDVIYQTGIPNMLWCWQRRTKLCLQTTYTTNSLEFRCGSSVTQVSNRHIDDTIKVFCYRIVLKCPIITQFRSVDSLAWSTQYCSAVEMSDRQMVRTPRWQHITVNFRMHSAQWCHNYPSLWCCFLILTIHC